MPECQQPENEDLTEKRDIHKTAKQSFHRIINIVCDYIITLSNLIENQPNPIMQYIPIFQDVLIDVESIATTLSSWINLYYIWELFNEVHQVKFVSLV